MIGGEVESLERRSSLELRAGAFFLASGAAKAVTATFLVAFFFFSAVSCLWSAPEDAFGGGDEPDGDAGDERVFQDAGGPEVFFAVGVEGPLPLDAEGEVVPPAGVDVEFVGVVGQHEFHRAFRGGEGEELLGRPCRGIC